MISQWFVQATSPVRDHSCIYYLGKFKSPSPIKMQEATNTEANSTSPSIQIDLNGLDISDISIDDVVDFNEDDLFSVQDFDALFLNPIEEDELDNNENSLIALSEIGATDELLDALLAECDSSDDSFDGMTSPIEEEETSTDEKSTPPHSPAVSLAKTTPQSITKYCAYITCNQPCTDFGDGSSNPLCDYHLQYLIGCRLNFQLKASFFKHRPKNSGRILYLDKKASEKNDKHLHAASKNEVNTSLKPIPFPTELKSSDAKAS